MQVKVYVLLYIELNMHKTIIMYQANHPTDYGPET